MPAQGEGKETGELIEHETSGEKGKWGRVGGRVKWPQMKKQYSKVSR